jgi:hypothetical protein
VLTIKNKKCLKGIDEIRNILYNKYNNNYLERINQMTTKREYLKQQGITVGARGRFSGAAKVAIEEAVKKGVTFTAEKPNKAK